MLTYEQALEQALAVLDRPAPATVGLEQSLGYLLAEDIYATVPWPRSDQALLEGWALNSQGVMEAGPEHPVEVELVGCLYPGVSWTGPALQPHQGVAIWPGAPMPEGLDTIIGCELSPDADYPQTVPVAASIPPGQHVRPAHSELAQNDLVLAAGTRITPAEVALLASQGWLDVPIWAKPVVALLTAGNELVEPGSPLSDDRVYNVAGPCLRAALEAFGIMPIDLGTSDDDPEALGAKLEQGLCANLMLVCGGDSLGHCLEGETPQPVTPFPQEEVFAQLDLQPGKLMRVFRIGSTLVCWLPGDPGSILAKFHMFVAPLLRALMGTPEPLPVFQPARLTTRLELPDETPRTFLPVTGAWSSEGRLEVTPVPIEQFRSLKNLSLTHGVIDLPAGVTVHEPGTLVPVLLW